jgi:hypothetical protein
MAHASRMPPTGLLAPTLPAEDGGPDHRGRHRSTWRIDGKMTNDNIIRAGEDDEVRGPTHK